MIHMKHKFIIQLVGLLFLATALEAQEISKIEIQKLREHVEQLASPGFAGRNNGSPGGLRARQYIIDHLRAAGLQPGNGKSWTQTLPAPLTGANILAMLPGNDPKLSREVIVVGAHYDHLGIRGGRLYPGANDNAAGVAVVLETARVLAASKKGFARSILFASWDAEEDGLLGSAAFVEFPPLPRERIVAAVDMDLIGRDFLDIFPDKLFAIGTEHSDRVVEAVERASQNCPLEVIPIGADLIGPRCDFWNFRRRKIPVVFFTSGEHHDYHRTTDLPDRIRYPKLLEVARLVESTLRDLAGPGKTPRYRPGTYHPREAAELAKILRGILAQTPMEWFERWTLTGAVARLERFSRQDRLSEGDRMTMRVLVGLTLLRQRYRDPTRQDKGKSHKTRRR